MHHRLWLWRGVPLGGGTGGDGDRPAASPHADDRCVMLHFQLVVEQCGFVEHVAARDNNVVVWDLGLAAKQAIKASGRMAGVVGLWTAVRSYWRHEVGLAPSAPLVGGMAAVGVPFMVNQNRVRFFQAYFKEQFRGMVIGKPSVVGVAMCSGAITFWIGDMILTAIGANWWEP